MVQYIYTVYIQYIQTSKKLYTRTKLVVVPNININMYILDIVDFRPLKPYYTARPILIIQYIYRSNFIQYIYRKKCLKKWKKWKKSKNGKNEKI